MCKITSFMDLVALGSKGVCVCLCELKDTELEDERSECGPWMNVVIGHHLILSLAKWLTTVSIHPI